MTHARHPGELPEREQWMLAAHADGRLGARAGAEVEAQAAVSPALAAALGRQRAARGAVREAAGAVAAPPRLRAWLAAELGAR